MWRVQIEMFVLHAKPILIINELNFWIIICVHRQRVDWNPPPPPPNINNNNNNNGHYQHTYTLQCPVDISLLYLDPLQSNLLFLKIGRAAGGEMWWMRACF